MYYDNGDVEMHHAARRHGVSDKGIVHAVELAGQRMLAIHAMPLRPTFFPLLTDGDG